MGEVYKAKDTRADPPSTKAVCGHRAAVRPTARATASWWPRWHSLSCCSLARVSWPARSGSSATSSPVSRKTDLSRFDNSSSRGVPGADRCRALLRALDGRARNVTGVERVGAISNLPMTDCQSNNGVVLDDLRLQPDEGPSRGAHQRGSARLLRDHGYSSS